MRHVLINYNLLGDGLMATPSIRAYKKTLSEDDELVMITSNEQFQKIYEGNPYIDRIVYVTEEQRNKLFTKYVKFDEKDLYRGFGKLTEFTDKNGNKEMACIMEVGKAFSWCTKHPKLTQINVGGINRTFTVVPHFAYAFADQLKVTIDSPHYDIWLTEEEIAWGESYLKSYKKPVLLCAALSKSCTSRDPKVSGLPANKMLAVSVWNEVIEELKGDYDFVFVAGPGEPLIEVNVNWEQGLPIRQVASLCKAAKSVVSVDTGIGHIAQGVDANIVSICAAVPRSLTSVEHTKGKYYCVDHTNENPLVEQGIHNVTSREIVDGIRRVA